MSVVQGPARADLPDYVVAMVRRLPPGEAPVVGGSTPVIAFGDPSRAEVATLGINPSAVEFAADGVLFAGDERRLATLASLGAQRLDRLTDDQVAAVVADCSGYFRRRPYRRWFDPLDELLRAGTGTSHYDATACHLDLSQWATDPVWGRITDKGVQARLLDDGVPHLRTQLARENVRIVLLNGRQVLNQVMAVGLAELTEVGQIPVGGRQCRLYSSVSGGVRWLGWSTNLQSSWGVSKAFKQRLGRWIADATTPVAAGGKQSTPAPMTRDQDGHVRRGSHVTGKTELAAVLQHWLAESSAPTLGDIGTFGGRAWLLIDLGTHRVALNADTKRAAVEAFLHDSTGDLERPWRVVANARGRINKVLPNPKADPLPGWYAYLTHPLATPSQI